MKFYNQEDSPAPIKSCIGRFMLILNKMKVDECWIAGGAIRRYFDKHGSGDTDVFFRNQDDYNTAFAGFVSDNEWEPHLIYENANVARLKTKYGILDFVKRFFEGPSECIRQFDFTVACASVNKQSQRGFFICHDTFFMDMASRSLVVNALPYPLSTLQRIQKYNKKGYTICNGGLLEIAKSLQGINLEQPDQNVLAFYPDGTPRFVGVD